MPGEGPDLSEAGPAARHGWLPLPSLHCTEWGFLPLICVHPTGNDNSRRGTAILWGSLGSWCQVRVSTKPQSPGVASVLHRAQISYSHGQPGQGMQDDSLLRRSGVPDMGQMIPDPTVSGGSNRSTGISLGRAHLFPPPAVSTHTPGSRVELP